MTFVKSLRMFSTKIVDKVDLPIMLKLATKTANIQLDRNNVAKVIRDETYSVIKSILFKYVFLTNIISVFIGFVVGMIAMWAIR